MQHENQDGEMVVIYCSHLPEHIDAIYYYNVEEWDCLQFSDKLKLCPFEREQLKQDLLKQKEELFERNSYWRVGLYPMRFYTSLENLGLEAKPIRALPPGTQDRVIPFPQKRRYRIPG
jgi:hypothetical protein